MKYVFFVIYHNITMPFDFHKKQESCIKNVRYTELSNVTFFNHNRHAMSSHGKINPAQHVELSTYKQKKIIPKIRFFLYLHCIVEIYLELNVKRKNTEFRLKVWTSLCHTGSNRCSSSSKLILERTRGTISLYADSY